MKSIIKHAFIAASALLIAACGSSAVTEEDVMSGMVAQMDVIATALESVDDQASADAAAATIEGAATAMKALADGYEGDIENPSPEVAAQFETEMQETMGRIMGATMTVATEHPELMATLGPAMDKLSEMQ